jgi:queuine tRNA-ribosyltransferase
MGVGTPANLFECIDRGVDMFDCVMPTRNARNGMLFTWEGIINIRNEKWKRNYKPIDENSSLEEDHYYSKAYLSHLFRTSEMLGPQLATMHNLNFYLELVKEARNAILENRYSSFKREHLQNLSSRL